MDSKFDPLHRVVPRHAETADSWMGIRRHEKDEGSGKHKGEQEQKEKPVWEDETVVSLTALRQFLENLVGAPSPPPTAPEKSEKGTASPPASKSHAAAQAYQTTAATASSMTTHHPPTASLSSESGAAPGLSLDETRTIHRLLADLDALSARGATTLTILKEGTFLESLAKAARRTLGEI